VNFEIKISSVNAGFVHRANNLPPNSYEYRSLHVRRCRYTEIERRTWTQRLVGSYTASTYCSFVDVGDNGKVLVSLAQRAGKIDSVTECACVMRWFHVQLFQRVGKPAVVVYNVLRAIFACNSFI